VTLPIPLHELSAELHETFREASVEIDRPADPQGEWWLDIACKDFQCNVAWRPDHGFGVFISKLGYADRPDEVYRSVDLVVTRLGQLMRQWRTSSRLSPLSLAEIRQLCDTRQTTLAAALDINQAAVSRLEHRDDMKLSSLQSYARAMGGRLEIRVHFDAFDAVLGLVPDDEALGDAELDGS
jgi:hypothetical protein